MAAHPGVTLRYNFGASGDLQKQIEAGAPIDVFLSAAQRQMDELEKQNLIVAASRRAFARNVLVVIKPADSRIDIAKPADLLDAQGGPHRHRQSQDGSRRAVRRGELAGAGPLGSRCSRSSCSRRTCARRWTTWRVARWMPASSTPRTPRRVTQGVKEAFRPPEDSYRPVVYPGAVVAAAKQPALGQAFLDLLGGAQGRTVLSRFGFQPPPAGAR